MVHRLLWLGLLLVAGCPESKPAAKATCTQAGERCVYDKNVLGVCEHAAAGTRCASPPCLVCTSQH